MHVPILFTLQLRRNRNLIVSLRNKRIVKMLKINFNNCSRNFLQYNYSCSIALKGNGTSDDFRGELDTKGKNRQTMKSN